MAETRVYADLTFMINLFMDYVLLWATARLTGIRPAGWRIFLAAFFGGIYGTAVLIPAIGSCYSLPMKLIFSVLILAVALCPLNWKKFSQALIIFYALSMLTAGASMAAAFLPGDGADTRYTWSWLAAGAACALTAGLIGGRWISGHLLPSLLQYRVEMRFDQQCCAGQGFLDTGNALHDPVTGRPVLVAEYGLLQDCLPEDFRQLMEGTEDENQILDQLTTCSWAHRLRLIPFHSIGKRNGILLGVRADEVMVGTNRGNIFHRDLVIGIYRNKLSGDGSYHLLIPSDVLVKNPGRMKG